MPGHRIGTPSPFGRRLQQALELRGVTAYKVDQLAKKHDFDWGKGYTTKFTRGDQESMPVGRCQIAAQILNVRPCWLAFGDGPMTEEHDAVDPLDAAVSWFEGRVSESAVQMVRSWRNDHPRPHWKAIAWGQVLRAVQKKLLDGEAANAVEITDEMALQA